MIYHEGALCRIDASWNRQCCCRYPTLLRVFDEFGFGRSVHADADHANNHRHNRGNEQRYLCSQRHALSRAT